MSSLAPAAPRAPHATWCDQAFYICVWFNIGADGRIPPNSGSELDLFGESQMDGLRFVARFVSGAAYIGEHRVGGTPNYESGGQEFESLRARHNTLVFLKNYQRERVAMQNEKICMASAWHSALKYNSAAGSGLLATFTVEPLK
jgi:hypothetical protein